MFFVVSSTCFINTYLGCEFAGTKDQMIEHLEICGYRGLQNSVTIQDFNLQVLIQACYTYCVKYCFQGILVFM